jgi:hypothetical protein
MYLDHQHHQFLCLAELVIDYLQLQHRHHHLQILGLQVLHYFLGED